MTFDAFVANRLPALIRYATVLACDSHLAQDIVQEVLLRAQSRWSRIAALDVPEQYVKRMVLNEFLSWRRRRATRLVPVGLATLDRLLPPAAGPDVAVDLRDEVIGLLAGLPPRQRAAVALRYYEGLDDGQIAELMRCRPVTVRTQISRALATLRNTLPSPTRTHGGMR